MRCPRSGTQRHNPHPPRTCWGKRSWRRHTGTGCTTGCRQKRQRPPCMSRKNRSRTPPYTPRCSRRCLHKTRKCIGRPTHKPCRCETSPQTRARKCRLGRWGLNSKAARATEKFSKRHPQSRARCRFLRSPLPCRVHAQKRQNSVTNFPPGIGPPKRRVARLGVYVPFPHWRRQNTLQGGYGGFEGAPGGPFSIIATFTAVRLLS